MKLGLFIGLSTLDIIGYVENAPTADQKVDALDVWVGAGGPTTNAAVTFRRLGGEARLIAAWGPGSVSSLALHDLSSEDVETTDVYASGDFPTSLVTVDAAGHRSVVSRNAAFLRTRSTTRDDIPTEVSVLTFDRHGLQTVHEVLDHGLLPMGTLRVADLGTFNETSRDVLALADVVVVPASGLPREARQSPAGFIRRAGGQRFVVTNGSKPMIVADGDTIVEIPVRDVSAVDTLGAGDVFTGALSFHLVEGDLLRAVRAAADIASDSCSHRSPRITCSD